MITVPHLETLARLVRYYILLSTTQAGSGHPSSSLSATDLATTLFFAGHFHFDVNQPHHPNNDRFILSKGHAAPLLYALYCVAGAISVDELLTLRQFGSRLEGHPTPEFPFADVATGSLGQGLSIGVGMALNAKYLDKVPYKTFVLLGDSEMAEGANWEAMALAAHYKLNNLIGIIDVNRLGQRGQTLGGHDLKWYHRKCQAFGWRTIVIDGHSLPTIQTALKKARANKTTKPIMIIAKTLKGKGVPMIENQEGWHGKSLSHEQLDQALQDLGPVDTQIRGELTLPDNILPASQVRQPEQEIDDDYTKPLATRKAFGHALVELAPHHPELVVLDAEVSNSTFTETFKQVYPERFFEMYIAEQTMVGVAVGLAKRGKIPFVSTFAAFFTRAFDQIRLARYSQAHLICTGSHAGVSIGADGSTQMGLEDIAMFRAVLDSIVVYPSDHISAEQLTSHLVTQTGICYLRTTREDLPPLYTSKEEFPLGGSKVLKSSSHDDYTIIGAGITVHEALTAHDWLKTEGITTRIIDLYSIKPIDHDTLYAAASETKAIFVVEDHYAEGGIGEAIRSALYASPTPIYSLAVRQLPHSGEMRMLLDYEGISAQAITEAVCGLDKTQSTTASAATKIAT